MKVSKEEERKRGAPSKEEEKRVLPNGLLPEQWERLQQEGELRGISGAAMLRQAVDWFITAVDTKRADVAASKMFDE